MPLVLLGSGNRIWFVKTTNNNMLQKPQTYNNSNKRKTGTKRPIKISWRGKPHTSPQKRRRDQTGRVHRNFAKFRSASRIARYLFRKKRGFANKPEYSQRLRVYYDRDYTPYRM